MYIIQASDDAEFYKVGKTTNLRKRITNYQSDKGDDIVPLFIFESSNIDAVEKCVKAFAKKYQYRKYKEIYKANINSLKSLIGKCSLINEETELEQFDNEPSSDTNRSTDVVRINYDKLLKKNQKGGYTTGYIFFHKDVQPND